MTIGDYIKALGVGVEIITDIEVDQAQLAAGQDVALPDLQVGTESGKPLYLKATLSTAK